MRAGPSVTIVRTTASSQRPAPAVERVAHVQFERIFSARDASDAALGPGGVAVRAFSFCHDRDRPVLGRFPGKTQSGNAAANDDEIVLFHGSRILSISRVFPKKTARARTALRRDPFNWLQGIGIGQLDVINARERGLLEGGANASHDFASPISRLPATNSAARRSARRRMGACSRSCALRY